MRIVDSKKNKYVLAGIAAGLCCAVMVIFPGTALESAQKGVSLWASSVLPALLPFFICANFMIMLELPKVIGRVFEKPFGAIFGAPGASAFVFIISVTSGYPMGAKIIGDMVKNGQIRESEAKQMLTFCTTSGPLFMLGAVGAGMMHSTLAGIVIAVSHYLGAVVNGMFYHVFRRLKNEKQYSFGAIKKEDRSISFMQSGGLVEMFTESILSALKSLGIICGYIVLFTMITDFLAGSGVLSGFSPMAIGITKGIFEMTVGCSSIAEIPGTSELMQCAVCALLISFGGISILAQSVSMIPHGGIGVCYYIKVKLTHGIFSFLIALFVGPSILNMKIAETGLNLMGTVDIVGKFWEPGAIYCFLFSTKMVIIVILTLVAIMAAEKLRKGKNIENTGDHS